MKFTYVHRVRSYCYKFDDDLDQFHAGGGRWSHKEEGDNRRDVTEVPTMKSLDK